jgi:hypothetical protein
MSVFTIDPHDKYDNFVKGIFEILKNNNSSVKSLKILDILI